jgi:hypothetical protein
LNATKVAYGFSFLAIMFDEYDQKILVVKKVKINSENGSFQKYS